MFNVGSRYIVSLVDFSTVQIKDVRTGYSSRMYNGRTAVH
jgi:hypothetical protein